MSFELPELPYAMDALAPVISAETIEFHYGKHHRAYVDNLNGLVDGTNLATMALESVIAESEDAGVFNNAAQVWNHTFYWNCMAPGGRGAPGADLAAAIEASFGGLHDLQSRFIQSAVGNFGSGWTWITAGADGVLRIVNTSNADTPIARGEQPILTCDVWEHAYYIDYRNARPKYLAAWWDLIDWAFVDRRFAAATGGSA